MADSIHAKCVVIGSGPGGYTAAFRAADLGLDVTLIERYSEIGGVCLNVGCIPSKALLHSAKVIDDAAAMASHGIEFGPPKIEREKLLAWKNSVVKQLNGGLKALAKQRKVNIIQGVATFTSANALKIESESGIQEVTFDQCIVAAGSRPVKLPFLPDDPRIIDSTGALELGEISGEMLVLGGGIIGCEMATVYRALGSKITIVEMMDQLMPGADKDLAKGYHKFVKKQYEAIMLETKVTKVEAKDDGLWVSFEGKAAPDKPQRFDRILSSVGRVPNTDLLACDKAGIVVNERNFIVVDKQLRTNVQHIFAIGDIVGQPMLAHKATHEAKIAAEVATGKAHYFEPKCIPSVAYTDPEVAWTGLTEIDAKAQGITYETGVFPWAASGRALGNSRTEGMTKVIIGEDGHILGAGILGVNAGELIAEVSLAIEMGCDAEDISLTIHPHPTLSETVAMATEMYEGTITDLYAPKKKTKK